MSPENLLLELEDVWKLFGSTMVLKGVDLALQPGQIHALLGGNGAGKSTLMKIISGVYIPDGGSIKIAGKTVSRLKPSTAHEQGVYLVPQEPLMFSTLSVFENLSVGLHKPKQQISKEITSYLKLFGEDIDLTRPASALTIAKQQIVEIIRGLLRDVRVLILDEPTSALSPFETKILFSIVKKLALQKVGVLFISHKLGEIRELAEQLSILRDGRVVLCDKLTNLTDNQVISTMTGDTYSNALSIKALQRVDKHLSPVLRVSSLSGQEFSNIDLDLYAGEVVGLAGVVGSGRTEILETLFGVRKVESGAVFFEGKNVTNYLSPSFALRNGLVYLPEDRKVTGLFDKASIAWNLTSADLFKRSWLLSKRQEEIDVSAVIQSLSIVCQNAQQQVASLSGGNQQKVLFAKCLQLQPKVLMLDEPTRGVDVKTRDEIYHLVHNLVQSGVAIILISSDLEEVTNLSNRVVVIHQGKAVGHLSGSEVTLKNIASQAFGTETVAALL